MRVGVTPDVHEQRGVVDDPAGLLIQSVSLGQPQRDQALPEDVLHRLAEPQVDAERQRRHELGQTDVRPIRFASHARTLLAGGGAVLLRVFELLHGELAPMGEPSLKAGLREVGEMDL